MSNIFFTSDFHFGHAGIIKHTRRPFITIEEMDTTMVDRYNSLVRTHDTVYILGDFAWKRHTHYLARLRGNKILVAGNHDKMSGEALRFFTRVYGAPPCGVAGVNIDGQYMVLSHCPQRSWNGSCRGSLQLFGHAHGNLNGRRWKNTLDVGVDCSYSDFYPLEWTEVRQLIASLPVWERSPDDNNVEGIEGEMDVDIE